MFGPNEILYSLHLSRPENNSAIKVFIREAFKRPLVLRPGLSVQLKACVCIASCILSFPQHHLHFVSLVQGTRLLRVVNISAITVRLYCFTQQLPESRGQKSGKPEGSFDIPCPFNIIFPNEVIGESDIRVCCSMVLPADGESVVIARPPMKVETFFQETLRSFNIAEPVVESSGAGNIRPTGEFQVEDGEVLT